MIPASGFWFLDQRAPSGEATTVASGAYARPDSALRDDALTFSADGVALNCSATTDTQHLVDDTPLYWQTVEFFDGSSPTLFWKERTFSERLGPYACSLSTPTLGTFQGGAGTYVKTVERLKTNMSLLAPDVVTRGTAPEITRLDEDSVQVTAAFGDDDLYFVALKNLAPGQPPDRRWFFSSALFGTNISFFGAGSFSAAALRQREGTVSFTADGYSLRCGLAPSTERYRLRQPDRRQSVELFDGSPKLYSLASTRAESWYGLDCSLVTPDMGTLHGVGELDRFHEHGRSNGIF